ncbi:MAG TPA: hypothetical protein VHE30_25500 [Polyangiaceae bacterium]|nr:hypothetical protein [Polyangiaceae bacterium]
MNLLPALAVALPLALAGCSSTPDGYLYPPAPYVPAVPTPQAIDTDAVPTTPVFGSENSVTVEYRGSGTWHLTLSCQMAANLPPCAWDVVASVDPPHTLTTRETGELESDDRVVPVDPGAFRLVFSTAADADSVELVSDPGVTLGIDAILDDGHFDPSIDGNPEIRWKQRGADENAATNPVRLSPGGVLRDGGTSNGGDAGP